MSAPFRAGAYRIVAKANDVKWQELRDMIEEYGREMYNLGAPHHDLCGCLDCQVAVARAYRTEQGRPSRWGEPLGERGAVALPQADGSPFVALCGTHNLEPVGGCDRCRMMDESSEACT